MGSGWRREKVGGIGLDSSSFFLGKPMRLRKRKGLNEDGGGFLLNHL